MADRMLHDPLRLETKEKDDWTGMLGVGQWRQPRKATSSAVSTSGSAEKAPFSQWTFFLGTTLAFLLILYILAKPTMTLLVQRYEPR